MISQYDSFKNFFANLVLSIVDLATNLAFWVFSLFKTANCLKLPFLTYSKNDHFEQAASNLGLLRIFWACYHLFSVILWGNFAWVALVFKI